MDLAANTPLIRSMFQASLNEITDILCGAILAVQKDPSRLVPVTMELTTVILTGDPHVVRGKLGDHHFRKPAPQKGTKSLVEKKFHLNADVCALANRHKEKTQLE
jgi:hypothetical protein